MNKTILAWAAFFVALTAIFVIVADHFTEPRQIVLNDAQALVIGEKIWRNEGAGKRENLVVWNQGEDFPSLGIGHFIWYPKGVVGPFHESFPELKSFMDSRHELPPWLAEMKFPPWQSREQFIRERSAETTEKLRQFLQDSKVSQTRFIVMRLESALPKILKSIKHPFARMHVRENFYRVANQPSGVYALVDYVNFKGEGISEKERYKNLGWGLAQVLEQMNGKREDVMQDFVDTADLMLTRRVENAPRDERQWLPGWRKRLQTYLAD